MRRLVLALCIALGGCDMQIRRGGAEPPPAEVAKMGRNPEFAEVIINDPAERDRVCRAAGVDANDSDYRRKLIDACADMYGKRVIFGPYADGGTKRHEYAHSNYYVHRDDGTGWLKVSPNIFAQQQQPVRYDWGNVFAKAQAPQQTAENLFRGR